MLATGVICKAGPNVPDGVLSLVWNPSRIRGFKKEDQEELKTRIVRSYLCMNLGRKGGLDSNILAKLNKQDGSSEVLFLFHFRSGKLTRFQDGNGLGIHGHTSGHHHGELRWWCSRLHGKWCFHVYPKNGFSEFRWKQDTRSPVGLFSLFYEVCVVKLKCRWEDVRNSDNVSILGEKRVKVKRRTTQTHGTYFRSCVC